MGVGVIDGDPDGDPIPTGLDRRWTLMPARDLRNGDFLLDVPGTDRFRVYRYYKGKIVGWDRDRRPYALPCPPGALRWTQSRGGRPTVARRMDELAVGDLVAYGPVRQLHAVVRIGDLFHLDPARRSPAHISIELLPVRTLSTINALREDADPAPPFVIDGAVGEIVRVYPL